MFSHSEQSKWGVRRGFLVIVLSLTVMITLVRMYLNIPEIKSESVQPLSVIPTIVPANSPDTYFEVETESIPGKLLARIGETQIPLQQRVSHIYGGLIPARFLEMPGHLRLILNSSDGSVNRSIGIEVFPRKHKADLRIEALKAVVGFDEAFSLVMTLTNHSAYPVVVTKKIDWFVTGRTGFESYEFEIRPSSAPVPYPPIAGDLYGIIKPQSVQDYQAAGEIQRLNAGESFRTTIGNLSLARLLKESPFNLRGKDTYALRLLYRGLSLPAESGSKIALLDESLYSNQIEIQARD